MEWLGILIAVLAGLWAMAHFGFWGFLPVMGALIAWGYHRSVKRRGG